MAKKPFRYFKLVYFGAALVIALVVPALLLYANLGILNVVGYFENSDIHKDSILLFFHEDCSYCANVDAYVSNNKVESKVPFIRLNVSNAYNENVLEDKAQVCGLDIKKIGVPFLWDGAQKKCVLGYVDIIDYFKQKMKKK